MKHRVTTRAKADLRAIRNWFLPRNPAYCKKLLNRLKKRFQFVAKFPGLGVDRSEFGPEIRSVVESDCRIFFRVAGPTVDILRVVHGSQDVTSSAFDAS